MRISAPYRPASRLNYSPRWQVLMVLLLMGLGLLYALPNLYGEDPALQISGLRGHRVDAQLHEQAQQLLQQQQIKIRALEQQGENLLIRLHTLDDQRRAKDLLSEKLAERYVIALNLAPATPRWLAKLGAEPLKLGLDLRGGVHFLLAVDTDMALNNLHVQIIEDLQQYLKTRRTPYRQVQQAENGAFVVRFANPQQLQHAKKILTAHYTELRWQQQDEVTLHARLPDQQLRATREQAIQQSMIILRKRVNELGVAEPIVQRQGSNRIVVELPGIQDTARAKAILGATALLEFRLVNQRSEVSQGAHATLPSDTELHYDRKGRPVALFKRVVLSGQHITDAHASLDEYGRAQVNITLDRVGGDRMAAFSKHHIGKPMATLFIEYREQAMSPSPQKPVFKKQTEVISVAYIESHLGNRFRITGSGTLAQARQLALLLRAGTLIAPLHIVEERTIGPTLGQQNIQQGTQACGWGLLATIVFMTLYYKKFGLIANTALLANLVLIIGTLSLLPGATLTLPGIAGIVLTIGMAVDANVLIFERIKEELNRGRTVQQAIDQGYRNAFSSIVDANLTTLITAIILYAVGTGPIKGFSITLSIGLATSMFTAIIGTRTLVNCFYGGQQITKLSI